MTRFRRLTGASLLAIAAFPMQLKAEVDPIASRVDFHGDLRLRYETVDVDDSATLERGRFRARLGLDVHATDEIDVRFQFATGDGSPVSTNLTFGDGFAARDLRIARAYVDWQVNDSWQLQGGKMKAPWFRAGGNGLVWDGDLNPEGVAAVYRSGRFFGSLAALAVEARPGDDSTSLVTAQGGIDIALGSNRSVIAGLGYYDYSNTVGYEPFYNGSAAGNSVDADGNYLFDYTLIEVFAEYRMLAGDWPLAVFGKWAVNTEVDDEDTGYALGVSVGADAQHGDMQFSYDWQDTDADAVIGTFNESDFAGGNTNSRGHALKAQYMLRDNVALGATLISSSFVDNNGTERDFDRIMLDIEFSFE